MTSASVSSVPLRVAWAPGRTAGTSAWWPGESSWGQAFDGLGWFDVGVDVRRRGASVEGSWRDPGWQPGLQTSCVTLLMDQSELSITVPPVWRAQMHLAWRENRLLASSDLRTLVHGLPASELSLDGVAWFLARGRGTSGLVPSLYKDVWTLQPGYSVRVGRSGAMECRRVWLPEEDEQFASETLETVSARLRTHLDDLAESILARHERVACLFSGGLDSSLVASTLLRRAPRRVILFNLGGAFGTPTEANLRARFLGDFETVSHEVDLPRDAGLVCSLRATNAVAALPVGSIFNHVFEEIIAVARRHGCEAVATGDGGDEVFAEREEVLVDLVARHRALLFSAAAHFALRNGERCTVALQRAVQTWRSLACDVPDAAPASPGGVLFGEDLAARVADLRADDAAEAQRLWAAGWTWSGLGSWRRAAAVPEYEPIAAFAPGFGVLSPLVDEAIVRDVLALRREDFVPLGCGAHRKRLLRDAGLAWLAPAIALHPKIGSADGELLRRMRADEHHELLGLLSSTTARRAGLNLPTAAEDGSFPLWWGDAWVRAAALVAWLDQPAPRSPRYAERSSRVTLAVPLAPRPPLLPQVASTRTPLPSAHVAILAILNVVAQLLGHRRPSRPPLPARSAAVDDLDVRRDQLTDLARRACRFPLVTGSSRPMHQALVWYLRMRGTPAALAWGTAQGTNCTRWWTDIGGAIVDVNETEFPLLATATSPAGSIAGRGSKKGCLGCGRSGRGRMRQARPLARSTNQEARRR